VEIFSLTFLCGFSFLEERRKRGKKPRARAGDGYREFTSFRPKCDEMRTLCVYIYIYYAVINNR
jgi:hypothetical protein